MRLKLWFREWVLGFFLFTFGLLCHCYTSYVSVLLSRFESLKSVIVSVMYQRRGKYAQVVVHGSVVALMVLGVSLGPSLVVSDGRVNVDWSGGATTRVVFATNKGGMVLGAESDGFGTGGLDEIQALTQFSEKPRAEEVAYTVQQGDTLGSIAKKFGVSIDTIRWANSKIVKSVNSIKPGESLLIPPVTGIVHTVRSGETIYSIAKKFGSGAQSIVDYPFNNFTNDETFALAIGQKIVVPDGVMPKAKPWSARSSFARILTPDAGAVSATGDWSWPAAGRITQPFRSWHKAIDIASRSGGSILAADSGVVVVAGWPDNSGYGNRVVLDHGNGYRTLYAHMSRISVKVGQSVTRGGKLGDMGSTGRSTGTHLHFEIRSPRGNLNPLKLLR